MRLTRLREMPLLRICSLDLTRSFGAMLEMPTARRDYTSDSVPVFTVIPWFQIK